MDDSDSVRRKILSDIEKRWPDQKPIRSLDDNVSELQVPHAGGVVKTIHDFLWQSGLFTDAFLFDVNMAVMWHREAYDIAHELADSIRRKSGKTLYASDIVLLGRLADMVEYLAKLHFLHEAVVEPAGGKA